MRMADVVEELRAIYEETLVRVSPARLVRRALVADASAQRLDAPVRVVALGKCAEGMLVGAAAALPIVRAFVAMPEGYGGRDFPIWSRVVRGGHPEMTDASFDAGAALMKFLETGNEPVVALVSGGSSACIEAPLAPWFDRDDLVEVNRRLLRAGLPIAAMNTVRRHLSALKGGRLGGCLGPDALAVILSDVARGRPSDVGSGPTFSDPTTNGDAAEIVESLGGERCASIAARLRSGDVPETTKGESIRHLLAGDNATLVAEAASIARSRGWKVIEETRELDGTVEEAASQLAARSERLRSGTLLVVGGEPTVEVRGNGRGGRACEVMVRFARRGIAGVAALFASSDGVDGSSDAAGWIAGEARVLPDDSEIEAALDASDSAAVAERFAERIAPRPTGNNLRDIFMVARASTGDRSNG